MYIGPGAGFAIGTSVLTFLAGLLASIFSLLLWPFRMLVNWVRFRKIQARAHVKKLIFIGFDGLDARLTERWMSEGKLPNLSRLREQGGYRRLRTTFPALSPVAWSTFATGVNPAKHNIFDFLSRSAGSYLPELSLATVKPAQRAWKKPSVQGHRKSESFWTILGRNQVRSTVLRVPVTFPPEKFNGKMLSAMCTPDIRGTQGTFTLFTTGPCDGYLEGGCRQRLRRTGQALSGAIEGPESRTVAFEIKNSVLCIQGQSIALAAGEYSPWLKVNFDGVRGLVRFLVTETSPEFSVYASPVQIDPETPALPISYPRLYALYLSKLMGSFATLGLAEDTWACNEGVISEEDFLKQAYLIFDERKQMFTDALKKTDRGVVGCVFDTSDRVQHMFFRQLNSKQPGQFSTVIEDMYKRMDDVAGEAMKYADDSTLLMVLSDHGFCSFDRGVNLNAWLRENGYLKLKGNAGKYFEGVDWSATSAYALGLGGLYLNLRGREPDGIVNAGAEADALRGELIQKLSGLQDDGRIAIREVYDAQRLYHGPYLDGSPDLIIGYNEGYRTAWGAALGEAAGAVFEDNDKPWSGDHCVDPALVPGVLFANRKIDAENPGIEDLAPTSLRSFGIDPPAWMDGHAVFTF